MSRIVNDVAVFQELLTQGVINVVADTLKLVGIIGIMIYMSPKLEWAIIAVSVYMRKDSRPRVVVPLMLSEAQVFDQHDEEACRALGIDRDLSNSPWLPALEAGREPPSWRNADAVRAAGADGIIDRSRQIPGGWHLNLFRWNELGGPSVSVCGEPVDIDRSILELK